MNKLWCVSTILTSVLQRENAFYSCFNAFKVLLYADLKALNNTVNKAMSIPVMPDNTSTPRFILIL